MRRYLTGSVLIAHIEVRYSPLYYGLLIIVILQYKVCMCNEACVLVKTSNLSTTESRAETNMIFSARIV